MEQGQTVLLTSVTLATPASRPRLHSPRPWVSGRRGLRSALFVAPPRLEQEPVSQQVAPAASDWLSGLAANTGNWSTGHSAKTGISSIYLINRVLSRGLARSLAQSPGPSSAWSLQALCSLKGLKPPLPGTAAPPRRRTGRIGTHTGSKCSTGPRAQPGSLSRGPRALALLGPRVAEMTHRSACHGSVTLVQEEATR